MDIVEERIVEKLDIPFYEKYKNLHIRGEIRVKHFADDDNKHLEYQFSNLNTLYKLSDAFHLLPLLKHSSLPERLQQKHDAAKCHIEISYALSSFFFSLISLFDSLAQEVNILFCNGTIDDGKYYFSNITTALPTKSEELKIKINAIKEKLWYKEINKYRNRLAHRSILPYCLKRNSFKRYLLRADLPFEDVILVHRKLKEYSIEDFQYKNKNVFEQCAYYFEKSKNSTIKLWEYFYDFLEQKIK